MAGLLRHRLRFRVGSLMLAILAIGLWLGYRVNLARNQNLAVAAVKADGGWVHYADEFAMGPVKVPPGNMIWKPNWGTLTPGKGPMVPVWLRRAIGDEYFREVAHVSLFVDIQKGMATAPNNLARPVDDILKMLRTQSGIKTLHLGGDTLTDDGLKSLADLTDLRELVLWWATGITDAGVAHLRRLPRLQILDISLSRLTDEGVRSLAELPALEELHLEGKLTDKSLLYLSRASHLKSLRLSRGECEFGDEGLRHLEGLRDLRSVRLQNAKVSKEAEERLLKAIPGLEFKSYSEKAKAPTAKSP
jgi:hypothetical protein